MSLSLGDASTEDSASNIGRLDIYSGHGVYDTVVVTAGNLNEEVHVPIGQQACYKRIIQVKDPSAKYHAIQLDLDQTTLALKQQVARLIDIKV